MDSIDEELEMEFDEAGLDALIYCGMVGDGQLLPIAISTLAKLYLSE